MLVFTYSSNQIETENLINKIVHVNSYKLLISPLITLWAMASWT
jgi:hypothetical protein